MARLRARGPLAVLLGVIILAPACRGLGGVRPRITPMVGSVARVVAERPEVLARALGEALRARQLPVTLVSTEEGYVESGWFDVDARTPREPGVTDLERIVKLRFFVDPVGAQSRVVGECVRRLVADPSLPERELERVVPDDHPGRALLDSVMVEVLGADTTRATAPAPR